MTGGLTPKNIKLIKGSESPFMKAFGKPMFDNRSLACGHSHTLFDNKIRFFVLFFLVDRGRLSNLMKKIPIYAVLPEDLGIRGARVCALRVSRLCHHGWRPFILILLSLIFHHTNTCACRSYAMEPSLMRSRMAVMSVKILC